jgi:hypothetical protein
MSFYKIRCKDTTKIAHTQAFRHFFRQIKLNFICFVLIDSGYMQIIAGEKGGKSE